MNKLEDRLNAAAEETRQRARNRPLPRFVGRPESRRNGALILASAFAVVIVVFGLLPFLMSEPSSPSGSDSTPSTPAETLPTVATTLGTAPEGTCSAEGVPVPAGTGDLPAAVAERRNAIIAAAAACDFNALEGLAGDQFNTSFGGGGVASLRLWEDQGQDPMATLLYLLDMRHTTIEVDDGADIYVWPAVAAGSWGEITEEELDELANIHSEDELDDLATAGSYLGWRTGIDQDGNWLYFVAGD